eukprot:scaffold1.g5766.t1
MQSSFIHMAAVKIDLKAVVPQLLGQSGPVPTAEVTAGSYTGLYFSASWCPPCRGFTPQLVRVYEKLRAEGKNFEVVFVSSDRNEAQFKLTVLGPDGSVVAPCARGAVGADPSGAGFPWAGAKSAGGGGFLRLIIMFLLLWVLSRFFTGK